MSSAVGNLPGLWTAAALVGLAWMLAVFAGPLARAQWPTRSPGLGVLAWQSLSLAWATSVILAGVSLLVPHATAATSLGELVRLCTDEVVSRLDEPFVQVPALAGAALVLGLVLRFGWLTVLSQARARGRRRRQRSTLDAVGSPGSGGLMIIEHETPAVYCVPGRGSRIVATSAATGLLSPEELDSVLAHERAHLRLRHHVAVSFAQMLATTFPWMASLRLGAAQVSRLVEMQADDAAGRGARPHLARALLCLALGPAGVLNAGGDTADRARRLLRPAAPLPVSARAAIASLSCAVVLAPIFVALLPGGEGLAHACCTLPIPSTPG
ncbi:M56 family metallopeptidase [Nocardioides marmoraquaticus]